jgi:Fe-S-cluster containining protein
MTGKDRMANIVPQRLNRNSKFKFECHKDVDCFTQCCRGINIILTPYDIIRLKHRLDLSSDEFLAIYTNLQILEKTDMPVVTLKLLDDDQDSCPFVRDDGCLVYEDRPTTCRYYPLGVASLSYKAEISTEEDFYFFINEPHCLGFEEQTDWTVEMWRKDQGVDIHDKINAEWTDLIVRKRSLPPNMKMTDQSKQMFFIASYNIDKFREFVFKSSFLNRYDIEEDTIEKIKNDELELLAFGLKWIKWLLFKEGDFKEKSDSKTPSNAR